MEGQAKLQHGPLYWIARHFITWCASHLKQHATIFLVAVAVALVSSFFLRALIHPSVLWVRTHFFLVVLGVPMAWLWYRLISRGLWWRRVLAASLGALLVYPMAEWGDDVHGYASLAWRYKSLTIVDLEELPTTAHERIHPRHGIYSLAFEAMGDVENPTVPNYVGLNGAVYNWTMAIEPAEFFPQTFRGIDELLSVSGTEAAPNMQLKESRVRTHFECSEGGHFSRNINTAVIKTFSLWRFMHYEPKGVTYVTDDKGKWIQVVKLIRWTGVIFPRPEFGGVQVIVEGHESFVGWLQRVFFGVGKWIPPEEIRNHKWLAGQNVVPYEVTRFAADSFKFQKGLLAPLPGYHDGDIRIPDQDEDLNPQPFAIWVEGLPAEPGQFVHAFSLEPYGLERQGTNTGLFFPADGHPVVYEYRYEERGETLPGVSTVPSKVMESRKMYTWGTHLPVEQRPFIRRVHGRVRPFWLTTVVTVKKGHGDAPKKEDVKFVAGGNPELAITAPGNRIIWVDPFRPETWVKQLEDELAPHWGEPEEGVAATTAK